MALQKRSWEERLFVLDMEPALGDPTDPIDSVETVEATLQSSGSATDVTIHNIEHTETSVAFLIKAGQDKKNYTIQVRLLTEGDPTQKLEAVVKLEVRDSDP